METALSLEPRTNPLMKALLKQEHSLSDLVSALGSPLNVVLPDQIEENLHSFRSVYNRHQLTGEIFFAHKANRSRALVRRLAATHAGIDIASLAELQHVLGAGFGPARIMATGPKTPEFLWLAALSGVCVNVDSPAEVQNLCEIAGKQGLPPIRLLVRLSSFESPGVTVLSRPSRFGTPVSELQPLLELIESWRGVVDLIGVAYHLDTIGLTEKAAALDGCLRVLGECQRRGMTPRVIDIGGGFGVDYLADGIQWERYTTELAGAVMGRREPLTWGGHGYGARSEAGTLRGALNLYPAHRPVAGPAYLDELLTHTAPSFGRSFATVLLEHMYELHIEPGRALVDQCGAVLVQVLQVRDSNGETLVLLDANSGDISLEEHGVLMDPVLIPRGGPPELESANGHHGVYLLGNLCLEADMISRRKVFLPRRPRPDDLLAFVNTAGYFMDFSADHALQQPIARTVAAYQDDGVWRWCLDDEYWPTKSSGGQL